MSILPVIERELRVAARKRFTYWSRLGSAGFLMSIFALMFAMLLFGENFGFSPGKVIFEVMIWTAFIFIAAWGAFLPCDALSEEKREGTLGLLFLTDLRGYDIVLGKLVPLSLRSFYALLAVLPVVALPLMMGGVAGVDFWRSALVMANMLFLALCIGLFVSAISREVLKAMNAVLFLNLFFLVGLIWADFWRAHWDFMKWQRFYSTASPVYLFTKAASLQPKDFWQCLIVQHCIAWVFLAAACVAVPRTWKEKTQSQKGFFRSLFSRFRFGGKRKRLKLRRKLVARSPVLWLSLRDRWLPRQIWIITVLAIGFLAWDVRHKWWETLHNQNLIPHGRHNRLLPASVGVDFNYLFSNFDGVAHLLNFGLIIWVAMQTCRFFAEATRSGAMELIMVTPMTVGEIVRNQWKALWRTFLFSMFVVLALRMASLLGTLWETWMSNSTWDNRWVIEQMIDSGSAWVNFIFRLMAIGWFGMWMGLANRKVSVAVLKTLVFVWLLPLLVELFVWIGSNFLEQYFAAKRVKPLASPWIWLLPMPMFELAKNILLIVWARHRVMKRFRDMVAQSERVGKRRVRVLPRIAPPPVLPKPMVT